MVWRVGVTTFEILAVCLLFALCFVAGGAFSGLNRTAQQAGLAEQQGTSQALEAPADQTRAQAPENPAYAFLIVSVCVGVVLAYLILRSSWCGWPLVGAIFVSMFGISTVATQVETLFFLSNKMPPGIIWAIFLQGAITAALFAPLAVLLLGKWRTSKSTPANSSPDRLPAKPTPTVLAVIVVAFVFLYMFFGYYVAWQNPALRQYYGGLEQPSFLAALKANWISDPWLYALQVFRALLYVGCLYPLIRMLRVARWEATVATAVFLSVWTTILLFPNPLMPPEVANTHFRETLGFSIVFGSIAGWLLSKPEGS